MSRYNHESPMDFEFQNGTGPLDGRSPFAQLSQNAQRFPPPMSGAKKRNYSAFDSPPKSKPSHPTSPSKPLPATPAYNSLFRTPRKPNDDIDDSSAGETPRSPEAKDDSDATPENMNLRALRRIEAAPMPTVPGAERTSPIKEKPSASRRDSWLMRQIRKGLPSPGRGELPRADHSAVISKGIEKRRKRDIDRKVSRRRRHSMSDSGDDSEQPPISPRKVSGSQVLPGPEEKQQHWLSRLFTFIGQHPTVPHILSYYAQLLFNVFLLVACGYLIYCFWSAVQGDVDKKSNEAMADIVAEMKLCGQEYIANKCDPSTRVPAMATVCENWFKCANRDPSRVGRAKVSAHTFAEIFNSFVEPISYKAMIFTALIIFGCFGISNFAFGFFRRTEANTGFPSYYQQPPPPTPQRQFSGQDGGFYAGTPWHQPVGFEPQPSGGYGQIDGRGSPVRRLQYQ